jgi:hypothetical protein
MTQEQEMTSFVLRLIHEPSRDQPVRWRGIIQHVQSNNRKDFTQLAEAVQFIQEQMGKEVEQDKLEGFTENAQVWGTYASKYQGLVFQSWLETVASPARIQQALTNGLKAWHLPDRHQQEEVVQTLKNVQARLEELTGQVEELEQRVAETVS